MSAKIIAVMNQKGGVGKTTTTVNLGAILAAEHGRRILLVDLDPQGNMSDHLGIDPGLQGASSVYDVILGSLDPRQAIRRVHGLEVLPSNIDLSAAEIELGAVDEDIRYNSLRDALHQLRDQYDFILIDCPPSLGVLTVSALAASDFVLIAMEAEYLAMRGMELLIKTVSNISLQVNPGLEIGGVVFCRYDSRPNLSKQVRSEVEKYLPDMVFRTVIRNNIRLAEAPSHGMPINEYDPKCPGTEDYRALTCEFMSRFGDPEAVSGKATAVPRDIMAETPILPEDDGRGGWQRGPRWGVE